MLKWLKFDHRFESQTFQLNFDLLKHFNSLITLKSHLYKPKSIPRKHKNPNLGLNFRGGVSHCDIHLSEFKFLSGSMSIQWFVWKSKVVFAKKYLVSQLEFDFFQNPYWAYYLCWKSKLKCGSPQQNYIFFSCMSFLWERW